jgi:hypothetical protein
VTDRREEILSRLFEILDDVPGLSAVYRNCADPNEAKMPAAVVFDADEEIADPQPRVSGRGDAATTLQFVTMRPEVYILLSARAADAGTRLNELRARIYKAVVTDAALISLVETNGKITLEACRSGFAVGRAMSAELKMEFGFTYVLRTSDL